MLTQKFNLKNEDNELKFLPITKSSITPKKSYVSDRTSVRKTKGNDSFKLKVVDFPIYLFT